jgi:AraC-like DNA-binding protein/ligand-binding sensor protein
MDLPYFVGVQTILDKPVLNQRNVPARLASLGVSVPGPTPPRSGPVNLPASRRQSFETADDEAAATEETRLVQALANSKLFREYERAFTETTGLPIALRAAETWQLPLHGKRHEGPWCALMASKSRSCANCLQVQEQLAQQAALEPQTIVCGAGLCEMMVPVRLGERLVGYLQTGQVFPKAPTEKQFERTARLMAERGVEADTGEMRQAYFATRTMPAKQQESVRKLLAIFAQHLVMLSNQIVVQQENAEPPVITKAKQYIQEHQAEEISLLDVARAVNTSSFYFCKMFRKVTGINFTDYVARLRIERAKNLLLNPNLRISEIAYEVGFQSLTHFNRVFKKVVGRPPTEYRLHLRGN